VATNVADKAIAQVALTEILARSTDSDVAVHIAEDVLRQTSSVKFRPSTRQLVLTFDLAFGDE